MKKLIQISILALTVLFITACVEVEYRVELIEGQDTVEINTVWVDAGVRLVVGTVSTTAKSTDTVDTSVLGLHTIRYEVSHEEFSHSTIRYVKVIDQTAPIITFNMGVDTVIVNHVWIDGGVTVTDNSLEDIEVVVTGEVDTSIVGSHVVTYTATDSSGNTTTITRIVTVVN